MAANDNAHIEFIRETLNDLKDEMKAIRNELQDHNAKIDTQEKTFSSALEHIKELYQERHKNIEDKLEQLRSDNHALEKRVSNEHKRLDKIEKKIAMAVGILLTLQAVGVILFEFLMKG